MGNRETETGFYPNQRKEISTGGLVLELAGRAVRNPIKKIGCGCQVVIAAGAIVGLASLAERLGFINIDDLNPFGNNDQAAPTAPALSPTETATAEGPRLMIYDGGTLRPAEIVTATPPAEAVNLAPQIKTPESTFGPSTKKDGFKIQDWCPVVSLGQSQAAENAGLEGEMTTNCIAQQESVCLGDREGLEEPCQNVLSELNQNFQLPSVISVDDGKPVKFSGYLKERIKAQASLKSVIPPEARKALLEAIQKAQEGDCGQAFVLENQAAQVFPEIFTALSPNPGEIFPALLASCNNSGQPDLPVESQAQEPLPPMPTETPTPRLTATPTPTETPDLKASATAVQRQIATQVAETVEAKKAAEEESRRQAEEAQRRMVATAAAAMTATRAAEDVKATLTAIPAATAAEAEHRRRFIDDEVKKVIATQTAMAPEPTYTPTYTPTPTATPKSLPAEGQPTTPYLPLIIKPSTDEATPKPTPTQTPALARDGDIVFPMAGRLERVRVRGGVIIG